MGDRRFLFIDLDDGDAALGGHEGIRCRRLNDRGGPDHQKEIAFFDGLFRRIEHVRFETFPKPNDVRTQEALTNSAMRRNRQLDWKLFRYEAASRAAHLPEAAMELDDILAAGLLMKTIDVLG